MKKILIVFASCLCLLASASAICSDWARDEIARAGELGLVPEYFEQMDLTLPLDRLGFAAVAVKLYEKMTGAQAPMTENPFDDTSEEYVIKAYCAGITNGVSQTEFRPGMRLNRETAATMLCRVYKKARVEGWTLATDAEYVLDSSGVLPFADNARISAWAESSVAFMAKYEIIKGVGENTFSPLTNATAEQAVIMSLRCYDALDE